MMVATVPHAASPPSIVRGDTVQMQPRTLRPGTRLRASQVGVRTFLNDRFGVGLAQGAQAQYPARTTDGGRTWRTDGPALHVDAAQGPLAVSAMGAVSPSLQFAYGGGNVVDVTADGGRVWRRALFDGGVPMAVVPALGSRRSLIAFVDEQAGRGNAGPTWQYVSSDGGRTWHHTTTVGG